MRLGTRHLPSGLAAVSIVCAPGGAVASDATLYAVYFQPGTAKPQPVAAAVVEQFCRYYRSVHATEGANRVLLAAHTRRMTDRASGLALSGRRAEVVILDLEACGIPRSAVSSTLVGDSQPLAEPADSNYNDVVMLSAGR
jgi:outer membrane protein OmpA-like peptidoglycan-associated protein